MSITHPCIQVSETPAVASGQVPLLLHLLSPAGRPVAVTRDLTLHRFENDSLHVLVDGSGSYRALGHPGTPAESLVKEGHLSEFPLVS